MREIIPFFGLVFALISASVAATDLPLGQIKMPPGFAIELWARVDNARQMALGRVDAGGGTLFVASTQAAKVHAVRFDTGYKAQSVTTLASGIQLPAGVAYKDGSLYVSAVSRMLRFDDIERRLDNPPAPVVITDKLPTETHHGWKFIAFGPDGKLYVPVGAPCNICEPDARHANILRMNVDGSGIETYARGIRNTVGFDWQPQTGELWFTDNGRDMLGDDLPGDELNHAPRAGMHFGYRITLVRLQGGKAVAYEPFASGWLQGETAWGRPSDVLVLPDGSLLVADDYAGAIYRIAYRG